MNKKPIKINQKIEYFKEFARDYSLFQVVGYTEFNKRLTPGMNILVDTGHPLILHGGDSLVKIYYTDGELQRIFGEFGKMASDVKYFNSVVKKFFEVIEEIKPYFKENKSAKNVRELKYLYNLYLDFCYGESAVWVAPLVKGLSKKLRDQALAVRKQTQELTSLRDKLFDYNLKRLFPSLGELTHFVLPKSIFAGKKINELLLEAKKYQKGFIYFNGKIYTGKQSDILRKLNIDLVNKKQSKKIISIKGQIASPGKIKGGVKIVLTNKDIKKVLEGDVLVSPMTRPDFLPAMKKASAFVTDEGGITCHASIVARELKKPCIIGTKIATEVLHDGDLVEVDANKGIVKILKQK
jgi:phosphohistidine swiveling domain-containing protein